MLLRKRFPGAEGESIIARLNQRLGTEAARGIGTFPIESHAESAAARAPTEKCSGSRRERGVLDQVTVGRTVTEPSRLGNIGSTPASGTKASISHSPC